jgi:hypothetical protein
MSKYVNALDLCDPSLSVTDAHTDSADVFVDGQLWERGIDPVAVTLPNTLLTEIASLWAKRQAATEGAISENSPLIDKARQFERDAMRLVDTISAKSLGLTTTSAYGSVTLGRG